MTAILRKSSRRKRKRKRRVRTSKRVRFFLLSLGIAGVVMGGGLCAFGWAKGHARFTSMGFIYIFAFTSVLLLRAAIVEYDDSRDRRRVGG